MRRSLKRETGFFVSRGVIMRYNFLDGVLRMFKRLFFLSLFVVVLLAGCQTGPLPTATQALPPSPLPPTATPLPSPTPTPTPRVLTVCLGEEPQTLYLYQSAARSMWAVLEAIYDGPVDTRNGQSVAVILEKLPALADGDALYQPVTVNPGDELLDADGNLSVLAQGVRYLPSGCTAQDCALAWDGKAAVEMDALTLTFRLLPGLKWADGAPLTAADSVYSFQVSADVNTPVNKRMVDRTAAYTALDPNTVQWVGKPGYRSARFAEAFWIPLPQHLYGNYTAEQLLSAEEVTRRPLGWGPYQIVEWVAGDHITLQANPNYFRAAEGLPYFDALVYRFLGAQPDNGLAALLNGECDMLDQSIDLESQIERLLRGQQNKELALWVGQGPEMEMLHFGIRPAVYDDGSVLPGSDRPDYFGDLRVRQAIAQCVDRQALSKTLLGGLAEVPTGFYPQGHPLFDETLQAWPYDPSAATALLEEVGWKESDGEVNTPRLAEGVKNVPNGTPFSVQYVTPAGGRSERAAMFVAVSLAQCGIQVNVLPVSPAALYASGPDGVLFGRAFELAQFSWSLGRVAPCTLYESGQLPTQANAWLGGNIVGYINPDYDAACRAARLTLPEEGSYLSAQAGVQALYVQDLPALPLYFRPRLNVSRPDLCGFMMDVGGRSEFWSLEEWKTGAVCTP